MIQNCCKKYDGPYEGKRVEDIEGLNNFLEEINTDFNTWTTFFKCRVCGQIWIEKYELRGHGEIAIVMKEKA